MPGRAGKGPGSINYGDEDAPGQDHSGFNRIRTTIGKRYRPRHDLRYRKMRSGLRRVLT